MLNDTLQTFEHVLELRAGTRGVIKFRFPKGARTGLNVALASADQAAGTIELVVDNLWHGYEMRQIVEGADDMPSVPIFPGSDGKVHATLDLNEGERLHIDSDDHLTHSLSLVDAVWQEGLLRLTFREAA
jgi:hypothetical protein